MALSPSVAAWKARQPNGRIPFTEMLEVPGTHDVDLNGPCMFMPEAARSFMAMREAMKHDTGLTLSPSRTYRTFAKQVEKYDDFKNHGGNLAAVPGTSNHGEALAGDMGFATFTDPRYRWLKEHGAAYGWHQNDASSEPWHWDYEGDHSDRFNFKEADMTDAEKVAFRALVDRVKVLENFVDNAVEALEANNAPGAGTRVGRATKKVEDGGPVAGHEHAVTGTAT